MTKARLDGLYLLMLGAVVFLMLGTVWERAAPVTTADFETAYYTSRCLIQHHDPYNPSDVMRIFRAGGGDRPSYTANERFVVTECVYLPTEFAFTVPFAMLAWEPAQTVWMALTAGSFIVASFLMWDLGARHAPVTSGALIGFCLANNEQILITGNPAGIAVGLCVVAVWSFLKGRIVPVGILCLAISLALKPQDAGLVWLYFLMSRGVYRKRALQTLVLTIVLCLPTVLWVTHISPHWPQEMRSNFSAFTVQGGINDPGPASTGAHGIVKVIDLQTVVSFFRNDPRVYNFVSYLVCGPLLLVWAITTLLRRPTLARTWLGLASIAALSMLPVYHRQYDAKLLLLTIPACAMLWAEGGPLGRLALVITTGGVALNADLPWAIFFDLVLGLHLSLTGISGLILTVVQIFSVPLMLLVVGIFYLWVYVRRCSAQPEACQNHAEPENLAPPIG